MAAADPVPSATPDPSLRVVRIAVEGLFDQFDHNIPLNQTDRVTVLHGPNGVGKTKVMEIVYWTLTKIVHKRFISLPKPFKRLRLFLSKGEPFLLSPGDGFNAALEGAPQINCWMIETQRLVRFDTDEYGQPETSLRVEEVARKLAGLLETHMSAYGRESQSLDRSYPQRVITKGRAPILSADVLKEKLEALEAMQKDLQGLGLLEPGDVAPPDLSSLESLNDTERRAMTLYVADTEKKLSVLSDFAARLRLFLRVTPQFLRKRLRFDRQEGLVVESDAGKSLKLNMLSSGEQHQLVLNYELLFATQANTLVLIDEPELSLHVTWQKQLLPNLIDIAKLAQIDIVVGTHSPFVIGDRADLMVALGGEAA